MPDGPLSFASNLMGTPIRTDPIDDAASAKFLLLMCELICHS